MLRKGDSVRSCFSSPWQHFNFITCKWKVLPKCFWVSECFFVRKSSSPWGWMRWKTKKKGRKTWEMCYWQWNNSSPLPCTVDGAPMKELWSNFFPSIFIFPLVWYSILSDKLDGVNQLVLLLCTHIPINIILWIIQVLKKMNKVMSMCFEFQYFSCDGWQILVEKKDEKTKKWRRRCFAFFLTLSSRDVS